MLVSKCLGQIDQHPAQDFDATPLLKAPMHGFIVGIALREHVPLCVGIENAQHRIEDPAGRHRCAAPQARSEMSLRKMLTDAVHCQSGKRSMNAVIRRESTMSQF